MEWVYKTKYNEYGQIDKHKACLVSKGYSQKHGVDYTSFCTKGKDGYRKNDYCSSCTERMEDFSAGCQVSFSPW